MDPSEFEGTVERQPGVLDAGLIEEFITGPKFVYIDFTKDIGDLYLALFNLQEILKKDQITSSSSFDEYLVLFDENAIKVTEYKEDYINHRKKLSNSIKQFNKECFGSITEDSESSATSLVFIKSKCHELIEIFKKEYDHLAQFAKFSEQCFLSSYEKFRNFSDYYQMIEETIQICLKLQDLLKKSQEQLSNANKIINQDKTNNDQQIDFSKVNSSIALSSLLPSETKHLSNPEDLAHIQSLTEQCESYRNEIMNLTSSHQMEIQKFEHMMHQQYEEKYMRVQQQYDETLRNKDNEVSMLLNTIANYKTSELMLQEKQEQVERNNQLYTQLEDKYRKLVHLNSELEEDKMKIERNYEQLEKKFQQLNQQNESQCKYFQEEIESLQQQKHESLLKLDQYEKDREYQPPIQLESFATKIQFPITSSINNNTSDSLRSISNSINRVTWSQLEEYIIHSFHDTQLRVKDLSQQNEELKKKVDHIQILKEDSEQKYKAKQQEILQLEQDLYLAHQMNTSRNVIPLANNRIVKEDDSQTKDPGDISHLLGDGNIPNDNSLNQGGGSNSQSSGRLLSVVQHQRDRYMSSYHQLEKEFQALEKKLEKVEEDYDLTKQENVELYRRLKSVRNDSSSKDIDLQIRSRRTNITPEDEEANFTIQQSQDDKLYDDIDKKYQDLSEQDQYNPYSKISQRLDNPLIWSRLTTIEKYVGLMYRYILQDQWTRNAFAVYLLFVHFFFFLYIFQVLNPQLADEVDQHLREKWSAETMEMPEHPDTF